MGHVKDRWTVPGPNGRRVKGPRHGRGKRWLASWIEPTGREKTKAFATKDAAEAHLSTVDVSKRTGSYVSETRISFGDYADRWLAHQVHQAPRTRANTDRLIRLHAKPTLGAMPLQWVTRSHIQSLISTKAIDEGMAPVSVRQLYSYIAAIFNSAVEDRAVAVTPCRSINLPPVGRRLLRPLEVAQVRHIADAVPANLAGMVWLGAGTGLRPGELKSLTVDRLVDDMLRVDRQLDEGTSATKLVWGPLKTDASYRTLQLATVTHKRLLEHLEQFPPGPNGLLFTSSRGNPLGRGRLSEIWSRATEGMGLPARSGWHDLRHHHASLLIASGRSPRAVADRLGHADPSETLRTYAHLWPSDVALILAAIDAAHGPDTDQPK
jgi:integrase